MPSNEGWRQLAKHHGGIHEELADSGQPAYAALSAGGTVEFNAVLRGSRADDGKYARWNAHGIYWTASESDPDAAWFYNFGQGAKSLNRHSDGNKQMAISVRSVRE